MLEYDQPCFERVWYKRRNLLFHALWAKKGMSPETFELVADLVQENIEKNSTTFRDAIKVENV